MKITEDRFKGVIIELPDEEINEKSFEGELKKVIVLFSFFGNIWNKVLY